MADLSHLTDDDLAQLAAGKPLDQKDPDLSHLTDDQLAKIANTKPDMGQTNAAIVQGENGATMGLRPVVAGLGAAAGAFTGTNAPFGSKLAAAKDAFIQGRSDANAEQNTASEQYPKTSIAANIGGSLLSAPLLPATVGLKGAIKMGAGFGVAQAAGSADSPGDVAQDVIGGSALGGLGHAAAETVGSVTSNALSNLAETKAYKSAGAMLKDFRVAYNTDPDKVNELGRTMLDNNLVKMGDSVSSVAQRADALRRDTGKQIGQVYNKVLDSLTDPELQISPETRMAVESAGFHPQAQADEMKSMIAQKYQGLPGSTAAINKANQVIDELAVNGNHITPEHALDLKGHVDGMIKYGKQALTKAPDLDQQALFDERSYIQNKLNDQVNSLDQVLGSSDSQKLKDLNSLYGNVATISSIAKDRVLRDSANRSFGLTDTIMASGGLGGAAAYAVNHPGQAIPAIALGLGAGVANKVARTYGTSTLAVGADALSRAAANPTTYTAAAAGPSRVIKSRSQLGL